MTNPITFEIMENGIAILRVNRPQARNALNWTTQNAFSTAVTQIVQNKIIRILIITGTGDSFIDFQEEGAAAMAEQGVPAGAWDRVLWEGKRLVMNFLDIHVPVIAAVNGPARAHSELAVLQRAEKRGQPFGVIAAQANSQTLRHQP